MASASNDNTIKLWDVATGADLRTLKGHQSGVLSVCFSRDGTRIASASIDKTVKLWSGDTGEELRTLEGHTDWIGSVCFSPDGTRIASASRDDTVKLWDAATGEELRTLEGHTDRVGSVCFSPDGTRIASGVAEEKRALPWIYFSDHWKWEPENLEMDPRPEVWGGLLAAFIGLVTYVGYFKRDRLAFNMAFVGVLAGGLGFTLGQTLQAKHSWTPNWVTDFDLYLHTSLPAIFPEAFFSLMGWNWWNMMETTFGLVLGFVLGLGLWFNRKHISGANTSNHFTMKPDVEWILILIYAVMLFLWSVPRHDSVDWVGDYPFGMGLIPLVAILGGRFWPYLFSLPLVAVSIAGITYKITDKVHPYMDRFLLFILPLAVMTIVALIFERRGRQGQSGRTFARYGLILAVVVYFSLNFVFFGYPWATLPNGGRHTNNWIFLRCSELLIFAALLLHRRDLPFRVDQRANQD
ncbi:MAG: hypothetical protein CMJ80_17200 [Planctomycetaceae bacterium]|nr:hypothetical protein [Planctomycetaceae bacterium]